MPPKGSRIKGTFTPATLEQYLKWLEGWIKNGKLPMRYCNYPFKEAGFLFVQGDFELENERGSNARNIILANAELIPAPRSLGHNALFHMSGGYVQQTTGVSIPHIPVYNDNEFLKIKKLKQFIIQEIAEAKGRAKRG